MLIRQIIRAGLAAALLTATFAAASSGAGVDDARVTLPVPTTATVTAAQLGADSVVAVVTHGRIEQRNATGLARSLEVITPDGARHPVYSVDLQEGPADWFPGDFFLADWRPELHTALLRVSRGPDGDTLVSYDVTTGATHQVDAPRRGAFFALDPDGSGVLMTTYATEQRPGRVATVDWDGTKTWLPARSDGPSITSPDGRTLVTTVGPQWWVTDLTTRTSGDVDARWNCVPHRWLDADSVVATCSTVRWSQLRLVDLDGTSSPLGVRHSEKTRAVGPPVFDDGDVRVVQGRSWFESYGGCGGGFLSRQTTAGKVRLVRIPGSSGALTLVAARGDRLVIARQKDDCDSTRTRATLTLLDPVGRHEQLLTRLGRDEAWREVIAATEVRAWIW
ncbi:hypothetical protein J2X46_001706 [Nocardioides sp. BE266]|uniref:hypothetical protein n=1 Tax=Nocardioides sp. BE266 TaxID=2817725 RepID=UPI002862AC9D|nr:hypothetical protein [Nocardioides sp. BE266]MDR7252730.1 hypothetical protein [Nocardioides sp. BE266]